MRILRLDLRNGQGAVDLHPFISIVQGLDPAQTSEVIEAIRGIVRGADTGHGGLVENNGELLEFRPGSQPVGPLTLEDIYVPVPSDQISGDPIVMKAEADRRRRQATIDGVKLEEARANLDAAAAYRVHTIQQALSVFDDTVDPEEITRRVKMAMRRVDGIEPTVREMPPDILEMLTEWERYERAREEAQEEIDAIHAQVEVCLAEREAAQNAVAAAQALAVPRVLSPAEDARVEELANPEAHGRKARRSTDEDHGELEALLARVGQTSYLDYVMYRLSPTPAPEAIADLERARTNLEQVEARLGQARFEMQFGDVPTRLNGVLEQVKATARNHLGPMLPSDLGKALREQVIVKQNPDWIDALRDLYDALVDQAAAVPDDIEPEQLREWAETWVRSIEFTEESDGPSRAELLGELAVAERRLDAHTKAMAAIEGLEARAQTSAAAWEAAVAQLQTAGSGDMGTSVDRALAMVRPLADRVRAEAGGSVPLILQSDFADVSGAEMEELFDSLEVLAQDLQLVILCNRAEAISWASGVGLRRALGSQLARAAG